ncbi:hypothetical protein CK203_012295 [Vitis vinifera]|uniref:Uncharacterized protein n=1 Tax=Vitis vinifera TaxID=29760 RepID=A0A438JL59_VITVI|nr:hypothetical protein CK203_012295 [Vitis vinifera]
MIGNWNPRFIRQLNDWELEEVDIFFERLYDHAISMDTEDSVKWVDTRVVFFLLGPSTPPWLVGEWILSLTVEFRTPGSLLESTSLLGRQLGLRY